MQAPFMLRTTVGLLIGAVLILTALLWREHHRAAALQTQLDETETRVERAISAQFRRTSRKPAESMVGEALDSQPTSPTPSAAAPAKRPLSDTERKFRQQMNEYRRWSALAKKADLLTAMNLPPDQRAALKDLLAERDYAERDARDVARTAGVEPHEAAGAEVAKIDTRIRDLLGEAEFERYTEQISLLVFRDQLEGSPIPGSLVEAGVPLTPEQKTWIAGMMYRAFGVQTTDQPANSSDPDAARRAFAAALVAEAPGKLTESQINALRDYFRKDDELAAYIKELIREQAERK